jgi:phosphoribosylformylglycinamidine synthase PurS subunit
LKFSIIINLKKDVLDPQGNVVKQTLQNMGMNSLKNLRQGKYFEIEIEENDEAKAKNKIEEMCKKLLVNLIIEDFTISQIK